MQSASTREKAEVTSEVEDEFAGRQQRLEMKVVQV